MDLEQKNLIQDYYRLGIKKDQVEIWEDGMRTDGKKGSYEWWYIDTELSDKTTVVTVFYTKNGFDVPGPAHPRADIDITYPDGTKVSKIIYGEKRKPLQAAKDKCFVQIEKSYLKYEEGNYILHFEKDALIYHAVMKPKLPMWRPETGHIYFDEKRQDFFAWFVAQPASEISGYIEIDGVTKEISGIGYHDHNWGNIPMQNVMNHWYWGRAKIGDYNIIASDIISAKKYGYRRIPIIMIAKDGVILEDDSRKTRITRKDSYIHEITGKFMDNQLVFSHSGKDNMKYEIIFQREKDILVFKFLDVIKGIKKVIGKLLKMNPTYVRSVGKVTLKVSDPNETMTIEQEGLWEQMFFGSNKEAIIHEK